jgi:hypothetical protein
MGYYRNERGFHGERRDYRDHRDHDDRSQRAYGGERGRGYEQSYERERGYGDPYRSAGDGYPGSRPYGPRDERDRPRYARNDAPADYDYDERGFLNRAGDEVRSWFGDEDAERRRELDARYDERHYDRDPARGTRHDPSYSHWRDRQIAALDRDYDEYRRENQTRFDSEFGSWRTRRTDQRGSLQRVAEHMDVIGSDGGHVGTVDKVRGDRIVLTRTDKDAGGHHHSIPSAWIQSVDDRVTISKTADEAQRAWRDEEQRSALFGDDDTKQSTSYAYSRFVGFY